MLYLRNVKINKNQAQTQNAKPCICQGKFRFNSGYLLHYYPALQADIFQESVSGVKEPPL